MDGLEKICEIPKLNSVHIDKSYVKCQFNNGQKSFFSDYLLSDDKAI
jgi:hypothetical protein